MTGDDSAAEACAMACQRTELHAATLPALIARDAWQLAAMTTDAPPAGFEADPGDPCDLATNTALARAHRQAYRPGCRFVACPGLPIVADQVCQPFADSTRSTGQVLGELLPVPMARKHIKPLRNRESNDLAKCR
jgi:hypothetical protein